MAEDYFVRPRAKLKLHGQSHSNYSRPLSQRLIEWWRVSTIDTTISAILDITISTLVSNLDEITHVDPEIQQHLRDNIARMRDHHGLDITSQMYEVFYSTLVSGFAVAENELELVDGKILLKSLINYDPSSITIRPDSKGRLVEGGKRPDGLSPGVFQSVGHGTTFGNYGAEVNLPLWKIVYLRNRGRFGNLYGNSAIEPVYRWHLLGDAIIDIMADAMDSYAEPWIVVSLAHEETDQEIDDPFTGTTRRRTTQEIFREQFQSSSGSGGKVITIPYMNQRAKPEVKVITPPANLGSMFIDTLDHIEQNKARGLLTPYVLIGDTRQPVGNTPIERRMEIYYRIIENLYNQFVVPLVAQTFHRLVRFNFSSRASSNVPPVMPTNKSNRPEDRVAFMQLVVGLTRNGFLNPSNEQDWTAVRKMLSVTSRAMDDADREYIDSILIKPLDPDPEDLADSTSGSSSGKAKKDDPLSRPRDRSREGKVNGKGNPGRPPGSSSPIDSPRKLAQDQQVSIFELVE